MRSFIKWMIVSIGILSGVSAQAVDIAVLNLCQQKESSSPFAKKADTFVIEKWFTEAHIVENIDALNYVLSPSRLFDVQINIDMFATYVEKGRGCSMIASELKRNFEETKAQLEGVRDKLGSFADNRREYYAVVEMMAADIYDSCLDNYEVVGTLEHGEFIRVLPKRCTRHGTRLQKVVFRKGGAKRIGWIRADVLRKVDVSVVKRELGKSF